MRLTVRNTHKYLSFFISLQLLLWTISGIYFAFNKIENVRGEQYRIKSLSNYSLKKVDFDIPDATSVNIKKRLDEIKDDKVNSFNSISLQISELLNEYKIRRIYNNINIKEFNFIKKEDARLNLNIDTKKKEPLKSAIDCNVKACSML